MYGTEYPLSTNAENLLHLSIHVIGFYLAGPDWDLFSTGISNSHFKNLRGQQRVLHFKGVPIAEIKPNFGRFLQDIIYF